MSAKTYDIQWKGVTLTLSEITAKMKEDYANWLDSYLQLRIASMPSGEARSEALIDLAADRPWWCDGVCSVKVAKAMTGFDGMVKWHRMIFGDSIKKLSDREIFAMVQAKQADPMSDYALFVKRATEDSDPKAHTSGSSEDQKAGTDTTASS